MLINCILFCYVQEGATKILQSHLRGAGSDGSGPLTPRSPTGLSNMSRPLPYR